MREKSADSPSQDQLLFNGIDQEQEQGDMISINYDSSDDPSSGDSHYQGKDETEVNESSKKRKRSDTSHDPVPLKRLGPNRKEIQTEAVSIRHSHPYSLHPRSEESSGPAKWAVQIVKASAYTDSSAADGLTYRPIGSGEMREKSKAKAKIKKTSRYADSSLAEGLLTSSGSGKMPGQSEPKANNGPPNGPKPPKNKTSSDRSAQKLKNTKSKGFFCFPFGGN